MTQEHEIPVDYAAVRAESIRQITNAWPAILDAIQPMLAEMLEERERAAVASMLWRSAYDLRSRLNQAFDKLEELGFATSRGEEFSASCCVATLTSPFVYWHQQDEHDHRKGQSCIGWAGDASTIIAELERAGLVVEWDGDAGTRILARLPLDGAAA